jgi:membrane protein DedA with SNARE-associated domain
MVSLSDLQVDSAFSYIAAFSVPALDAVYPLEPSETAIVALGVAERLSAFRGSTDRRVPFHSRWPHSRHAHLRCRRLSPPAIRPATAVAGAIWAPYAFSIGRLGGKALETSRGSVS